MSAWMCSDVHFSFVAKAAEVHGLIEPGTALAFAGELKLENMRSLDARYGAPITEHQLEALDLGEHASRIEDAYFVTTQLHCLDYQSCEHDGWESSNAKAVCDRLVKVVDPTEAWAGAKGDSWGID